MSAPLIVAGGLGLAGAGIHGIAGQLLVVRKLTPADLPGTRIGGPKFTRAMIFASWHLTTVAFVAAGAMLLLAGTVLDGEAARALAFAAAAACTGFAVIVLALGVTGATGVPKAFLRHPAPILLTVTAALAWSGALAL